MTVSVVCPDFDPPVVFTVAVMVELEPAATRVARPFELIVAVEVVLLLHETPFVRLMVLPSCKVPVAVN